MNVNTPKPNVFHVIIIVIISLVVGILGVGLWNHITIAKAIHASTKIVYCHGQDHVYKKLYELQSLSYKVLDESGITFLTTIVIVMLVSIGIYFLKNAETKYNQFEKNAKKLEKELDDKSKQLEKDFDNKSKQLEKDFDDKSKQLEKDFDDKFDQIKNATDRVNESQNKINEKINLLQETDDILEKASQTLRLHVPISFIYTLSSIWAEKEQQQPNTLMSFFQKIDRQIDNIEDSIKKETNVSLNRHIKESLIIYLFESIKNINKIIEINQLDNNWTVPNDIIFDLNEILKSLSKE
jgi:hypothetical protein